ncbi:MAG: ATP-dependent 6-phosphofructokinase [Alphaproteobacteria bacterium]|nr:ATP-dependent 6-phosphofructokinase [Alphaproteobacteria bacterium]
MTNIKKIGVLTSGGDCAGLNAVVMSVVNAATRYGWEVYGIHDGTDGLTNRPLSYEILTESNFSNTPWPRLAGSYLGSLNTGMKESQEVLANRFGEGVRELGLDAVVVVGGDGSMNIVSSYCKLAGVKMVGIPKTIDNDTPLTDFSVGFNTACQVCSNALDDLMTTARSHHRALILEVMGRDAGHLAMHSALAGFADVCLVPEIPYTLDGIINKLESIKKSGRTSALIVVSEGVKTEKGEAVTASVNMIGEKINGGIGEYLSNLINANYKGFQTRVTKLGHVQRSGNPTAFDRGLAVVLGAEAIRLLAEGHTDRMVALTHGEVTSYTLEEVVKAGTSGLNAHSSYIKAARSIGMYVGEEI